MGFHEAVLMIKKTFPDEGAAFDGLGSRLGWSATMTVEREIFKDVGPPMGCEDVAVSQANAWTIFWGRPLFEIGKGDPGAWEQTLDEWLRHFSVGTQVFHFIAEETSGSYVFNWYEDGVRVRSWGDVEGRVYMNYGEALPSEPKDVFTIGPLPEGSKHNGGYWDIVSVMEKQTGVSWDTFCEAGVSIFSLERAASSGGEPTTPENEPWWKFW